MTTKHTTKKSATKSTKTAKPTDPRTSLVCGPDGTKIRVAASNEEQLAYLAGLPKTETDTAALRALSADLYELHEDYETACFAVGNVESQNPEIIAATIMRLNRRLQSAIDELEAARGGRPIHPVGGAAQAVTS